MKQEHVMSDHYGPKTADEYESIVRSYAYGYDPLISAMVNQVIWVSDQEFFKQRFIRILDLGAGTGYLSRKITESLVAINPEVNVSVTISDNSEDMLSKASDYWPYHNKVELNAEVWDLRALPSGMRDQFDVVVSSFAFHHLDTPEKLRSFSRVREYLKPGGTFVIGDRMVEDQTSAYRQHLKIFAQKAKPLFEKMAQKGLSFEESVEEAHKKFVGDGDQPQSVAKHLRQLEMSGFKDVHNPYYDFGFSIVVASKPKG